MKRLLLILMALITALGLTESLVRYFMKYPSYGVENKVRYRIGADPWTNIRKPYAGVFSVEGRTVTKYNNYGFPGTDIENLDHPIVLLGSSYVEALQFQPEEIASSIFEDNIRLSDPSLDVVNLGASGHDPYDSYFRLRFFDEELNLESPKVVLIINSDNQDWFNRHPKPLRFDPSPDFGQENLSTKVKLQIVLRNSSSLIELAVNGLLKGAVGEDNEGDAAVADSKASKPQYPDLSNEMMSCIKALKADYPDFMAVSVYNDVIYNATLEDFCKNEGIEFYSIPLTRPEFLINGAGHLNQTGNEALGEFLADKFLSSSISTNQTKE